MDNDFKRGFFKLALDEQTEVAPPEEDAKETVVTCMSNCTYSQNPEKRCMLESVSLSMDEKSGAFTCGQYSPAQETQDPSITPEPQPQQQQKQPGLPGTPAK